MKCTRIVFLTFFITVVILSISAFAQTTSPVITVDSVSGVAGATVDVEVTVENNVGILGAALTLSYDENLTLKEFSSGNAFSMLTFTPPGSSDSPCTFIWDGENLSEDDIKNGAVLKLRFEISDDALPGDIYNICISCDDGQMRDYDLNIITPDFVDGAVSIMDYMPGDLNGDTGVDVADVIMLRRHLAGGYMQTINTYAIDVNADGDITISDLILLRRYLAGGYNVELLPGTNSQISSLTIWSDDVESYSLNKLEYYLDPVNSSKTAEINIDLEQINYNSNIYTSDIEDILSDIISTDEVELYFTDNDDDEVYDELTATKYVSDIIKSVDADSNIINLKSNGKIEVDLNKTVIFENETGRKLSISDFSKNDVVAIVSDTLSGDSYDEFIKVILLSDSVVTGVIDEMYWLNDSEYVVINDKEYICDLSFPLVVGDKGTFYISKTGKIIDVSIEVNYAYVLEAAASSYSFSTDTWEVKLLTAENGVVTYDVTDGVNEEVSYYLNEYFADDEAFSGYDWLFENSTMKDSPDRLITYELNSKNQIKNFAVAGGSARQLDMAQYSKESQIIDGCVLEDDVIIFNITSGDADDAFTTDISSLYDKAMYTGFIYRNEDAKNYVMVISDDDGTFNSEDGFAIVTKVSMAKDAEGNEVVKVNCVRDEEENTIVFNEDSDTTGDIIFDELSVGDVFFFRSDINGTVTNYEVIAQTYEYVPDDATELITRISLINKIPDAFGDYTDFVSGYIENDTKVVMSKGEIITVNETAYLISDDTNKYTFNNSGRNTIIETEDFLAGDAYYFDEKTGEATPVILRIVDGLVKDIYTSNDRVCIN